MADAIALVSAATWLLPLLGEGGAAVALWLAENGDAVLAVPAALYANAMPVLGLVVRAAFVLASYAVTSLACILGLVFALHALNVELPALGGGWRVGARG